MAILGPLFFPLLGLLLVSQWRDIDAACPNWCNQRGRCSTPTGGDGECICDVGFTGDDCSLRLCPMAFDPLTVDKRPNRRTIRLETKVEDGVMGGLVQFSFAGSKVLLNADASSLDDFFCTNSLAMGLKSAAEVVCQRESFDFVQKTGSYLITFLSFPVAPYLNNLIYHTGNPALDLFECDVSKVDPEGASEPQCLLSDVVTTDLPEYLPCAGRGDCDRIRGLCHCQPGFKGKACDDVRDNNDLNVTVHHGPFFTGTMLKLQLHRSQEGSASDAFNLFQARLNDINVTTIRGDRRLTHRGLLQVEGADGRIRVASSSASSSSHLLAQIESSMCTEDDVNVSSHHFVARSEDVSVFSIDRQGNTEVHGEVIIGGGQSDGGVKLRPNGTLSAKSVVLSDALHVQGSATVAEGMVVGNAVSVSSDGRLSIAASTESTENVVSIEHLSKSFGGAVISLKSDSDVASFLRTESNGLTTFDLSSNGTVRMSALKLHSGGILIDKGGMAIKAGGLSVRGGFTLESGDFNLLDRHLAVGSLTSTLPADEKETALIDGRVASSYYVGAMLRLSAPPSFHDSHYNRSPFQFLSFQKTRTLETNINPDTDKNRDSNNEVVFEVDGDGFLRSSSGASFGGESGVKIATPLHIDSDVFLAPQTILASWNEATEEWIGDIPLTSSANYLTIKKSSQPTATTMMSTKKGIRVRFNEDKTLDEEARHRQMGRVLFLSNADDITTSGVLVIPPHTTIIVVFNGVMWQDIAALRAPMQVLTNVERFEAKNDLFVGNVSFSASRFQATSLSPGSVLFVNKQQFLSEHRQKFFYSKGTLHAPSLKIDKLAGSLDAQGNDVSNLLLSNPKIVNGVIQASEISLSSAVVGGAGGGGGLAYFTQRGQLLASKALALDEDNHLLIRQLYSDIDGNGHALNDVSLRGGHLQGIMSAEIDQLRLKSTKINLPPPTSTTLNGEDGMSGNSFSQVIEGSLTHGALIGVDSRSGGDLVPLPTHALKFDFDSSVLSLDTVAIHKLHSSLDVNGQTIRNARISSSTFTDIRSLSVQDLVIESFSSSETEGSRLVYADHRGRLQAYSTSQSEIDIPNLTVTNLQFTTSSVSLHDKVLEHAKLNASSVEFVGSAPRMVVQSLVIENNQVKNQKQHISRDSGRDRHFLFSSSSGEVAIIPGLSLSEDEHVIDFSYYSFKAMEIDANSIRISSTGLSMIESSEGANIVSPPLGIERSSGKFVFLTSSSLKDLSIRSKLVIQSGADVIFERESSDESNDSVSASGLLAVDNNGRVVKISTSSSFDGEGIEGERKDVTEDPKINARFHLLHTSAIVTDQSIKTSRLTAREISLIPSTTPSSSFVGNPLLVQDVRSGLLETEAKIYVSPEDHSLHVSAIYPATSLPMRIQSALIEESELRHSSISDATSIVTNELTVKQSASFQSPVTILSSLAVYGTVSGAGPYIDTSDRRFKQNIRPVEHALDLIDQLQAVRYEYKQDETSFSFPRSTQIGWIAQEVKEVLPEIVFEQHLNSHSKDDHLSNTTQDDASYYSIAYSHSCPLLAEGIKELHRKVNHEISTIKQQYEDKITSLQEEMNSLKELVLKLVQTQAKHDKL